MINHVSSQRRGEWLELMPGKLPRTESGDRVEAAMMWLLTSLGAPAKLLNKLASEGGIKLAGDRLRLHLFSPRVSQYEPLGQEAEILYEDDFCLVVHKPAGVKVHPDGKGREPTLSNMVSKIYTQRGEIYCPRAYSSFGRIYIWAGVIC